MDRVARWLEIDSSIEFKLDATSAWTPALIDRLAATDTVRIVDLKGQYKGTMVDQPSDPDLYRRIVEGFPEALIEDPILTDETRPVLAGNEHRISWDAPITDVQSVQDRPWAPAWLNLKPSRCGTLAEVFAVIEYGLDNGIRLYGGGQTELGVGRQHLQALASLFYPDAPNDIAPRRYNDPEPVAGLPRSPLSPPAHPSGFEWWTDGPGRLTIRSAHSVNSGVSRASPTLHGQGRRLRVQPPSHRGNSHRSTPLLPGLQPP